MLNEFLLNFGHAKNIIARIFFSKKIVRHLGLKKKKKKKKKQIV